jgi:hypothetical protein
MPTLHIEHAVTGVDAWRSAFARFEDARRRAGVTAVRVARPVDRDDYLMIDLDFPSTEQAADFLGFLRRSVWATPANSPALAGAPTAMVLTELDPAPAAGGQRAG